MLATLGAPGIYERPEVPLRRLTGVRMDVCAFVGVAPRGPARVRGAAWPASAPEEPAERRTDPRAVESWDEYLRLYGGFEGPGLLPYAVASFFEQGGRRAYVARVVHAYDGAEDAEGVAWGAVGGILPEGARGLPIRAQEIGRGANGTVVELTWTPTALPLLAAGRGVLTVAAADGVVEGDLLCVQLPDGERSFVFVDRIGASREGDGRVVLSLAEPLPDPPIAAERVTATLRVTPVAGAAEEWTGVGLTPAHPAFLGAVLRESAWAAPHPRWLAAELLPASTELAAPASATLDGGFAGRPATGLLEGVVPVRDGLWVSARDEGSWGNSLRATLSFRATPILPIASLAAGLHLPRDLALPAGSRLVFRMADGSTALRRVIGLAEVWREPHRGERVIRVDLDAGLPAGDVARVEVIEGELEVDDLSDAGLAAVRRERHPGLGFSPAHPRWIGRVLLEESALLHPDAGWIDGELELLGLETPPATGGRFSGGQDRWAEIVPDDFFDPGWTPAEERPGEGLHSLVGLSDLSLVVAPDLYSPAPIPAREDVTDEDLHSGPEFRPCVHVAAPRQAVAGEELAGLRLDPRVPAELARILDAQRRLTTLAAERRSWIALLDVPPGLGQRQVLEWRAEFDTAFAAAYHPWPRVARGDDERTEAVEVNPAAVAAGIIARQEWLFGVQHGPANALAAGVVSLADAIGPERHDELHPAGINVFLLEREGVRLTAARTLSRVAEWRQLNVRRLVTMIARTIEQEMQWAVFEPHDASLRAEIVRLVTHLLRRLHRAGAFRGNDETDSFFVRCDDALNPRASVDAGRLVVEIGIAPAEPVEWIVLRLARVGDGTVRVEG